ncbi:MAG: TIGR02587 family membrane protein [Chloroflexota bacterium]|nr:TIGR02587 family membrane protein [Chloroflexota bacterium]
MNSGNNNAWKKELEAVIRSLMRALIFGIAFLYTMETWWIGSWLAYWKLLSFFVLAFLFNLALLPLVQKGGDEFSFPRLLHVATRNQALAVIASALILYVMGRITPFTAPLTKDLTTIVLLSIPIGLGASIAHILEVYRQGRQSRQGNQQEGKQGASSGKQAKGSQQASPWRDILRTMVLASGGALFVALPLAPTIEIPMLAARMDFWREFALIVLSLLIAYAIVYEAGANKAPPSGNNERARKLWPLADTLMSYLLALGTSFVVLYLLGRIDLAAPLSHILALTIVLALPASIGAAAGKLAL